MLHRPDFHFKTMETGFAESSVGEVWVEQHLIGCMPVRGVSKASPETLQQCNQAMALIGDQHWWRLLSLAEQDTMRRVMSGHMPNPDVDEIILPENPPCAAFLAICRILHPG